MVGLTELQLEGGTQGVLSPAVQATVSLWASTQAELTTLEDVSTKKQKYGGRGYIRLNAE